MSNPIDPRSLEDTVRQALQARAEQADISNDAWDRVQSKLAREATRRRRRFIVGGGALLAAAAAIVVAISLAAPPDKLVQVETPPVAPSPIPTVSITTPKVEGEISSTTRGLPASTGAIQVGNRGDVWLGLGALEPSANVGSDPVVQISGSPDGTSFRYVSSPTDGAGCSTVRDFALSGGEPRDIVDGFGFADVAARSLLVVAQNVDAQDKVSCGTASTRRIALIDPASGDVLSTLALREPLATVTGIAVRPDGNELTMSTCEAACIVERVAIDGDRLRRVETYERELDVFGVAYRGDAPVIGRDLSDQGGRHVVEDLDGNKIMTLEGGRYTALQGDLRGERAVAFADGDVTEIDWRGGADPVVRRIDNPTTATGDRRLPLASGYFYGAVPRPDSDAENIRERRVFDAYERMWVASCCGEPSHGRATANFGFVWNGVEVSLLADRPGGSADRPGPGTYTEQATDTVDSTEVLTYTTEDGPTFSIFTCGGTNYQLWRIDDQSKNVPPEAVAALIRALPCSEPLASDVVAAAAVAVDANVEAGPVDDLRVLGAWWALTDRCVADGGDVGRCYDAGAEIMVEVINLDPRSITTDKWDGAVLGPDEEAYTAAADALSLARPGLDFDSRPPIKVVCDPSCEAAFG